MALMNSIPSSYRRIVSFGCMAAATTILGVAPLIQDVFWVSMALVMMFGLILGTCLTVILIPKFYAAIYKIKSPAKSILQAPS